MNIQRQAFDPNQSGAFGSAGRARQRKVTQQCDEDTRDDGELLQRAKTPSIGGRRHLRDISRRDHAGCADGRAAAKAEHAQSDDVPGETRADRAREKDDGRDLHDGDASVAVGERTGEPGTDRGARAEPRPRTKPSNQDAAPDQSLMASTAPLMTAVSKPNRKPPMAAEAATSAIFLMAMPSRTGLNLVIPDGIIMIDLRCARENGRHE